jgi:hypothetical protein
MFFQRTKHLAGAELKQSVEWFGFTVPTSNISIHVQQVGPGLVFLYFDTLLGRFYATQAISPISSQTLRVRHSLWASWRVPRFVAKLALRAIVAQFDRDVAVWDRKTHLAQPLLVPGDGPILRYRRWFSQFYVRDDDTPEEDEESEEFPGNDRKLLKQQKTRKDNSQLNAPLNLLDW